MTKKKAVPKTRKVTKPKIAKVVVTVVEELPVKKQSDQSKNQTKQSGA